MNEQQLAALYEATEGKPRTAEVIRIQTAFDRVVEQAGRSGRSIDTSRWRYTWSHSEAVVRRTPLNFAHPRKTNDLRLLPDRSESNGTAAPRGGRRKSTVMEDEHT